MIMIMWFIAKLSQAPALAGVSLALFPVFPATRTGRPDPADQTRPTWQE